MEAMLLDLLSVRRGHFRLESGHHGDLRLDLDRLFLRPALLVPFAREQAARLSAHRIEMVVGPLSGGAFIAQMVAAELDPIVDDAINAGSATRATHAALAAPGAQPVAVGAMIILENTALPYFAANNLAGESIARLANELWEPAACPLCAAGVPFSSPAPAG